MSRLGRLALGLTVLASGGCATTSSTEVGVRTTLFGILEKRGQQTIYEPGRIYFVMPFVNSWHTLPISQQNLLMTANPAEGDRPLPDDVTFKTKDGNNIYIDVNVMWRIDPRRAGDVINHVGQSLTEIRERLLRPLSRAVIRDVFNEISSEEYYQVAVKNRVAALAKDRLAKELEPYGVLVDMLQVQQHRFDAPYQAAIDAQKQAEADVQTLLEQQKNMEEQKKSELEARRSEWNKRLEDALGEAGRARNASDGYYQTKINEAKAILAVAQARAEGIRKQAEALARLGGDAYVRKELAKQLANKKIVLVPGTNVSTMDVNRMVEHLLGRARRPEPVPEQPK